jgi:hypothetical protein
MHLYTAAVVGRGALLRPITLEQSLSGVAAAAAVPLAGLSLAAFLLLAAMAGRLTLQELPLLEHNPAAAAAARPLELLALALPVKSS